MDGGVITFIVAILIVAVLIFLAILLTGKRGYTFNKEIYQTKFLEIENKLKSAKLDITVAKKDFFPRFNIFGFQRSVVFQRNGNFFQFVGGDGNLIFYAVNDIGIVNDTAPTAAVRKEVSRSVSVFKSVYSSIFCSACRIRFMIVPPGL